MKKPDPSQRKNQASADDRGAPLTVWGERRRDPDWDRFLAALIALALRRVDDGDESSSKEARG